MREARQSYRINQYLAQGGYGSRRKAEQWVLQGRVTKNGKTVSTLDERISLQDQVRVNNNLVQLAQQYSYFIFNKPRGYVVSCRSQKGQKTIYDLLPKHQHRLRYAGRLDKESRGLMILSDNGDLIYELSQASREIPKCYKVRLDQLPPKLMENLRQGLVCEGITLRANKAKILSKPKNLVEITLLEGRNRHIRKMMDGLGIQVLDLYRYSIGKLNIEQWDLAEGSLCPFDPAEFFSS